MRPPALVDVQVQDAVVHKDHHHRRIAGFEKFRRCFVEREGPGDNSAEILDLLNLQEVLFKTLNRGFVNSDAI